MEVCEGMGVSKEWELGTLIFITHVPIVCWLFLLRVDGEYFLGGLLYYIKNYEVANL